MAPSKAAWINVILKLTPIVVSILKPELAPLANQIAQSISAAESQYGDETGPTKLKQVTNDIKSETKGFDTVTIHDIRKIISATVDTANLIHDTKQRVSR